MEVNLKDVVDLLLEDEQVANNWQQIYLSLNAPHSDITQLKNGFKNSSISVHEIFMSILTKWIKTYKEKSTVQDLIEILKGEKLNRAADELNNKWDPSCHIIPPVAGLRIENKWWPVEQTKIKSFMERRDGNERIVEKLKFLLRNPKDGIKHQLVISGLGGIGKTTLAKWYAIEYQADYTFIFWINCAEGNIRDSFAQLASTICPDLSVQSSQLELNAAKCFEAIKAHHCLLIYDNAESYNGINGIIDALPKQDLDNIDVLITSRWQEWGSETGYGVVQQYKLGIFSTNESIAFLSQHVKIPWDEKHLVNLAEIVGNLPLALQMIVSSLNNNKRGDSIGSFIEKLRETNKIVETNAHLDDYQRSLYATMKVSIDMIRKIELLGELAYTILQNLAYCPPDNNPIEFLAEITEEDIDRMKDAAEILENYSLVLITPQKFTLNVHRLLQKVIDCINKREKTEESILEKILSVSSAKFTILKVNAYICSLHTKFKGLEPIRDTVLEEFLQKLILEKLVNDRRLFEASKISESYVQHFMKKRDNGIESEETLKLKQYQYGFILLLCEKYQNALNILKVVRDFVAENFNLITTEEIECIIDPFIEQFSNTILLDILMRQIKYLMGESTKSISIHHVLKSITIRNKSLIPFNIGLLGVERTMKLVLVGGKFENNICVENESCMLETIEMKKVELIDTMNSGRTTDAKNIFPKTCKTIKVSNLNKEICMNIIPTTCEDLFIENADIVFENQSEFKSNIKRLFLNSLIFKGDLNFFLSRCTNLYILSLNAVSMIKAYSQISNAILFTILFPTSNDTHKIDFNQIPKSCKDLRLSNCLFQCDIIKNKDQLASLVSLTMENVSVEGNMSTFLENMVELKEPVLINNKTLLNPVFPAASFSSVFK